ncbi:Uncharacterized protein XB16_1296 [Leptospira santarosai]|uniref:YceK/YidQ family lipoprotein n=1 Tax=Leptospira santarosai TaxID=28183 RepID=A0A2P1QRT5_9LEPT|nr:Uncharacterized protein XB16_1296 [Leptospira santarosai]
MKRSVFILLLFVVVLKCSSISEHGMENHWGHPYLGTQIAITYFPCNVFLSSFLFYIPVPIFALDIPLSFVVDTILLPGDLLLLKPESQRPNREDAYCVYP